MIPRQIFFPIWSPDGSEVVFASDREGPRHLYKKNSTGAGKEEVLLKTDSNNIPMDWSPDGKFILYAVTNPKTKIDLWLLPLFGDQKPVPFLQTDASERLARFSPDGRWVAYVSDASGNNEIYAQTFPPSGGQWQVSNNGGYHFAWARDGKELFYISTDKKMMVVDVKGDGPNFELGTPRMLFELKLPSFNTSSAQLAGTADGQRFLVAKSVGDDASTPLTVVVNWTAGRKH